jgi:anti-anti-sigma factor
LRRVKKVDFWIAVAAVVGVLSAGVLAGVVIGIALSLVWLVYVATTPPIPLLGREPGTQVFRDVVENPDDQTFEGIPVVRVDGGLFFATVDALDERVRELATDDGRLRAIVLSLEGVDFVDSQGAAKLAELERYVRDRGGTLRLARVKPTVVEVLRKDGFVDRIGADHVHGNVHEAVEAALRSTSR